MTDWNTRSFYKLWAHKVFCNCFDRLLDCNLDTAGHGLPFHFHVHARDQHAVTKTFTWLTLLTLFYAIWRIHDRYKNAPVPADESLWKVFTHQQFIMVNYCWNFVLFILETNKIIVSNSERFLGRHDGTQTEIIETIDVNAINFIRKMSFLYEQLCEISDEVNYCFSFQVIDFSICIMVFIEIDAIKRISFSIEQIMIDTALTFTFMLTTLFTMYRYSVSRTEDLLQMVLAYTNWAIFFAVSSLYIEQ